jgi:DNA-binding Lrp family transcriptional regulator
MLDRIDRGLIHGLQIDARAPFSKIAATLGTSPQTVARHYQRLRAQAALRVVGLPNPEPAGWSQWLVRLTASPQTAQRLADALVRREDTAWVKLASGGTKIITIVRSDTAGDGPSLLLRDVPRMATISSVSAQCLLHMYVGGRIGWRRRASTLTEEQQSALGVELPDPEEVPTAREALAAAGDLVAALRHDGRASLTQLASATGWSPPTVARRLVDLQVSGAIFFDVEVDPAFFGTTTQAMLWLSVTPSHLNDVAAALSEHVELAFLASTTGEANLVATAVCADPADLHRYLAHELGALDGIRSLETAPLLRTLKTAGPARLS